MLVTYACVTHVVRLDRAHKKAITRIPQMYYTCIQTAMVGSRWLHKVIIALQKFELSLKVARAPQARLKFRIRG